MADCYYSNLGAREARSPVSSQSTPFSSQSAIGPNRSLYFD
ncbi:hypothetical protein [Lyngbya sp. CCAP 1446/10]|nr:hypothetical protein [Lyngbya sp. CCAP 1446/10]